jgi:hypothetical protein
MIIGIHYVPSFYGDIRFARTGDKTCTLIAEQLSLPERDALIKFDEYARRKKWLSRAEKPLIETLKADLLVPVEKAGKRIAKFLKPHRKLVTAVRFQDGRMEEVTESRYDDVKLIESVCAKEEKPKPKPEPEKPLIETTATATTVAAPFTGCPLPDFETADVRATRVLNAFLDDEQREDFAKHQGFITVGADTGHRYMVVSRNATGRLEQYAGRQLYDMDADWAICTHDWQIPAAEELLSLHVMLSLPGWERNLCNLPEEANQMAPSMVWAEAQRRNEKWVR